MSRQPTSVMFLFLFSIAANIWQEIAGMGV